MRVWASRKVCHVQHGEDRYSENPVVIRREGYTFFWIWYDCSKGTEQETIKEE